MDYHLYSFERPTSIADNQTKQLALLSAPPCPCVASTCWPATSITTVIASSARSGRNSSPRCSSSSRTRAANSASRLPAGIVRVYAKDSKGAAQFVGEDRIEHTAKNEKLKLRLGEAFDITAERKQTNYKRIADTSANPHGASKSATPRTRP